MKILLVEDHAIVRQSLGHLIGENQSVESVDEADTVEAALEMARRNPYDLVLLDIHLPDGKGTDIIAGLKEASPGAKVLMLSSSDEQEYAVTAFRAGASGYLHKNCEYPELIRAIESVMKGKHYVSPSLSEHIITAFLRPDDVPGHLKLSEREREVFRMIVAGHRQKDIAKKLNLSPKTVSTYKSRILEKFGFRNSTELARYAEKHGLTD